MGIIMKTLKYLATVRLQLCSSDDLGLIAQTATVLFSYYDSDQLDYFYIVLVHNSSHLHVL